MTRDRTVLSLWWEEKFDYQCNINYNIDIVMIHREWGLKMNEVGAIKDKKQIEKVKNILRRTNLRDYLLFVMGINVGLRISDLLKLKFRDLIDDKGNILDVIKIKEVKTGKTKTF